MIPAPLMSKMRRVASTGVHVRTPLGIASQSPCGDALDPRLARVTAALDRLAAGALPNAAELAGAPVIHDWMALPERGGFFLVGRVDVHPRLGSDRRVATSPVIAIDSARWRWMRTVSRYYLLGRPRGAGTSA